MPFRRVLAFNGTLIPFPPFPSLVCPLCDARPRSPCSCSSPDKGLLPLWTRKGWRTPAPRRARDAAKP